MAQRAHGGVGVKSSFQNRNAELIPQCLLKPELQKSKKVSNLSKINCVQTRCIVIQGVFVNFGNFIKFSGFLAEFLENRRS